MKSDFYLKFRNIFPFRCFKDNQFFYFYYNSVEKDIILYLESGWTNRDDENVCGTNTTKQILDDLTNQGGYKLLLKVSRNQEQFKFEEKNSFLFDSNKSPNFKFYQPKFNSFTSCIK
jgi:hypothetical protein